MPLFMMISGYVTRYSRPMESLSDLFARLGKRSCAYLIPWAVWSFVVRGFLLGEGGFLDVGYLLWHMDNGYWFLTSLWTISCVFALASFLGLKLATGRGEALEVRLTTVFFLLGMGMLATIGLAAGLSFFGIKLTLYYMPFYFIAHLFGRYQDRLMGNGRGIDFVNIIVIICFAFWVWCLVRLEPYGTEESVSGIAVRAAMSFAGCAAVCGLAPLPLNRFANCGGGGHSLRARAACRHVCPTSCFRFVSRGGIHANESVADTSSSINRHCDANLSAFDTLDVGFESNDEVDTVAGMRGTVLRVLEWIGCHSLEVYLVHCKLLGMLPLPATLDFAYLPGRLLVIGNFALTVLSTVVLIAIIERNKIARKVLWWKN